MGIAFFKVYFTPQYGFLYGWTRKSSAYAYMIQEPSTECSPMEDGRLKVMYTPQILGSFYVISVTHLWITQNPYLSI